MRENEFWKVCEALDNDLRIALLKYLTEIEQTEFPCVNDLAERFRVSSAAMSVHLKKLAQSGLVSSQQADRRAYYRAFATTSTGRTVMDAMRKCFATLPDAERLRNFREYAHALSHRRRNAIVRYLHAKPGTAVSEIARHTEIPLQTVDRLWGLLNKAHIIDLTGSVIPPSTEPELTLLQLTLI